MIACFPKSAGKARKAVIGLTPKDIVSLMLGTPVRVKLPVANLPPDGSWEVTVLFGRTEKEVNDEMVLGVGVPPSLIPQDPDVPAGLRG